MNGYDPLPAAFYQQDNVLKIARDLLGKLLCTNFDDRLTIARIVETESYNGVIDRACHAWGGRNTQRTAVMYRGGGTAYVYLCYGIHHLFNVVTNMEGIPHAVLIRAAEPVLGTDIMLERMGKQKLDHSLTRGPGNVSRALGISTRHTGLELFHPPLWIADDQMILKEADITVTKRIGVDYAGEDALLPYRFIVRGSKYVSGKKAQNLPCG